jgi:hypothetical protein
MTAEEWRPVVGFPDYRVSSHGRVVSLRKKGVAHEMRGGRNQRGYRMVSLRNPEGRITVRTVHRIVSIAFLGPTPDGLQIRHLDGNKDNCAVENLAFGTPSQNMLDQVRHGVHAHARKTHCPRGHAYDHENTHSHGGRRYCRACQRERNRLRRATAAIQQRIAA